MNAHEFEEKIAKYVKKHHLLSGDDHILVALSGGADSVALLRVLLSMNIRVTVLHCNFGLRGTESDRDEMFVRSLCELLGVSLKVKTFDVIQYEKEHKVSTEMACRELRYSWFSDELRLLNATSIAVAHHHDDDIETFFLNMLRGSGIQGLSGIKPKNGDIVRPLLCVTRNEIECYLEELDQNYIVDSTNLKNEFKRNKIRNVLIPTIAQLFPESINGLSKTLENMKKCNDFYQEKVADLRNEIVVSGKNVTEVNLNFLDEIKSGGCTALFEILSPFGFNSVQINNIYKLFLHKERIGGRFYSTNYEVVLGRDKLEIFEINSSENDELECEVNLVKLLAGETNFELKAQIIKRSINAINDYNRIDGKNTIALSKSILKECPVLTLRHWNEGDRIKPYGMKGSKLVSDLFVDAKYTALQKRNARLLCAGDDILWVCGLRSSRLFTVTSDEDEYLKIEYMLH